MPNVYFACGETSGMTLSDLVNISDVTTAGKFDATYARSGIKIVASGSTANCKLRNPATGALASPTAIWLHIERVESTLSANGSGVRLISFLNASGTEVFRLVVGTSNTTALRVQYRNSAGVLTTVAAVDTTTGVSIIDLFLDCAGTINIYSSGVLQGTSSGTFSSTQTDNIQTVSLSTRGSDGDIWSQCIVADESTIGWKLKTLNMTADGNYTAGTGTVTDVNEAAGPNDATFSGFASIGDKETYVAADVTVPTNYALKGVSLTARAKLGATGPQTLKGLLRIGGSDYNSPVSFPGLNQSTFDGSHVFMANDPSTSTLWTATNVNGAEYGVEAAA